MDFAGLEAARQAIGRVEVETPNGWSTAGTAFIVADRIALTALHVVADRSAPQIQARGSIRILFGAVGVTAEIRTWDVESDWALLTLDRSGGTPLRMSRTLPWEEKQWWTFGYPRLNDREGIAASFDLRDPNAPYDRGTAISLRSDDLKGTEVRGLSGAPLLRGDAVYGVFRSNLEEARKSFGYLYATPVREIVDRVDPVSAAPNPFQGMRPFEEDRASFFFGREAEADSLAAQLAKARLAILVGGSGSGKSSLLRAGLIPKVRLGRLSDDAVIDVVVFRPGPQPIHELSLALLPQLSFPSMPSTPSQFRDRLWSGEEALSDLVDQELQHRHGGDRQRGGVLLVVDQLEELYGGDADPQQTRQFMRVLCTAARKKGGRVWVAGAIRDGFMSELLHPGLDTDFLRGSLIPLGPIATEARLRELILKPALRAGLRFEPPTLPDTIARDAADQPGALPLLQYALDRLWQERRGELLTASAYRDFGGVQGVIAHQADATVGPLEGESLDRARRLFLRLVWIRTDGPNTRRLLPYDSLPPDVRELAFRLVAQRLLVTTVTGVEIAHEALIREWMPLRAWVKEAPEGERRLQELEHARERWADGHQRREDRLPDHRLQPLAEWALAHTGDIPHPERRFLVESLLSSTLPPEKWGAPLGAEAILDALDAPPGGSRPVEEELLLLRALYVASSAISSNVSSGEQAPSRERATQYLEQLLLRESGHHDSRSADFEAARLAMTHEGPDWLVSLADRAPSVRESLVRLLGVPELRPSVLAQLPQTWGKSVRRRAALRIAWENRTTLLFVASSVFLSTFLLGRVWWLGDFALEFAGLSRTSWDGNFYSSSLAILAALGAWFSFWQYAVRRTASIREIGKAAIAVMAVNDLPILLANLRFVAVGKQELVPYITKVVEAGFVVVAYAILLRMFVRAIGTAGITLPSGKIPLGRAAAAALVGLIPGMIASQVILTGNSKPPSALSFLHNWLNDFAAITLAIVTTRWAARAAILPAFEGPQRPSTRRIARAVGLSVLIIAIIGTISRWKGELFGISPDPARFSEMFGVPPGTPIPSGFKSTRLQARTPLLPSEGQSRFMPAAGLSFDDRPANDIRWENGVLLPNEWRFERDGDEEYRGIGAIIRLRSPLEAINPDAIVASADPADETRARALVATIRADVGGVAEWRAAAKSGMGIEPVSGGSFLVRSWQRGQHDLLAELTTQPLGDGSLVVAWRIVLSWPRPEELNGP